MYSESELYVVSLNGEEWEPELFCNQSKAIEYLRELIREHNKYAEEDDKIEYGYIGLKEDYQPQIDAERVVENLSEDSYNDSPDYGDGWLIDLPDDDLELLQDMLDDTLKKWINKTGNHPLHYEVKDEQKVWGRD